jgi:hypothetical protein
VEGKENLEVEDLNSLAWFMPSWVTVLEKRILELTSHSVF